MGAAVNLTDRIQSIAAAGEIVLSESAYSLLKEQVSVQVQPSVDLKGLPKPVPLYVVKPFDPDSPSIRSKGA